MKQERKLSPEDLPAPRAAVRVAALGAAVLLSLGALTLSFALTAAAQEPAGDVASQKLEPRFQRFLEDAALLMTASEREVFLGLKQDFKRDQFIRQFWRVRDPFAQTARNEFQEQWEARVARARELFTDLTTERAKMLLYFGEPKDRRPVTCADLLNTLEVWTYEGSDRVSGYFTLVFLGYRPSGGGPGQLWQPRHGLRSLFQPGVGTTASDTELTQAILQGCLRGDEIVSDLAQSLDLARVLEQISLVPKASDEWVQTFSARSTELAPDQEPLPGVLRIAFPGRHQSRTVVQGLVEIPTAAVGISDLGGHQAHNLLIDGEILRQGELFDHFRYRFDLPRQEARGEQIPLIVQRYLRPGQYQLILKVEDLNSKRAFREELTLDVPLYDPARAAASSPPAEDPGTGTAMAAAPGSTAETTDLGAASSAVDRLLSEANASISTGDHVIEILGLPAVLTVGKLRVQARVQGEGIAAVQFELNGRPVMKKGRPPYSIELDLGQEPQIHELRATALDPAGRALARDEVLINAGPHRFSIRLLEPQRGKVYQHSVRAHAEVEVPEGEKLERVEFYRNDTLLATLFQAPFEQPILLPEGSALTYIRAVAYLDSGQPAEDLTIINAPDFVDQLDVDFVELYTTVVDRKGNFVEGLTVQDFTVVEEGVEQEIRRFETVRDVPIHAGIVLDTSMSMQEELGEVERAAYSFLETVLTPRDRAAVITFNDHPQLAVRFTHDKAVLAGGLASLTAEGETALYDSIIFALHYFSGLKGKRAIVLLTDGEDSRSTYTFENAIEFARRIGVAIYIIGLNLGASQRETQMLMQRLASETGGGYFTVTTTTQLARAYEEIQAELRAQYLLAYQSKHSSGDGQAEFRRIEVKLSRKDLKAKTQRGYFP